jgi:hypothetical protein
MGWASGKNVKGRTIGYSHRAVCDEPGCHKKIDLGLAYCCGGLDGVNGEAGCGDYFCGEHLWYSENEEIEGPLCVRCIAKVELEDDEIASRAATSQGRSE